MKSNILDIQNNNTTKNKNNLNSSSIKKETGTPSLFDSLLKEAKIEKPKEEVATKTIQKDEIKDSKKTSSAVASNTKDEKDNNTKLILKKVATSLVTIISDKKAELKDKLDQKDNPQQKSEIKKVETEKKPEQQKIEQQKSEIKKVETDKKAEQQKSEIKKVETEKSVNEKVNLDNNKIESKNNFNVEYNDDNSIKIINEKLTTDKIGEMATNLINDIIKNDKEINILNKESKKVVEQTNIDKKDPFIANMFLSSQAQTKQNISNKQLFDAKKNINENQTIKSIKESANMLDLNVEEIETEIYEDKKNSLTNNLLKDTSSITKEKDINNIIDSSRLLNKVVLERLNKDENKSPDMIKQELRESHIVKEKTTVNNIRSDIPKQEIKQEPVQQNQTVAVNIRNDISKQEIKTTTVKDDKVETFDKVISMTVPKEISESIQTRIIAAHQKVGHFMSETARNMYLNYQAPMNAFRISLNPANLGTIAIVMRSNKVDNSISISMNMSNPATMDLFSDSKSLLQSALGKNFTENSNINLSFGMQDNNSDTNSQQFSQNENSEDYNGSNENSTENKQEDIDSDELLENSNQYA